MEHIRQIRFVMAPTFFVGSLLLGAVMDGWITPTNLYDMSGGAAALIVAAAAASILPLGFIFGGSSILFLRIFSQPLLGFKYHEAAMDEATLANIFTELRVPQHSRTERTSLYADAVYSAEKVHPEVRAWVRRRWDAFNAQISSFVAIFFFAIPIGWGFGFDCRWVAINMLFLLILGPSGWIAWREIRGMKDFLLNRF